MTLYVRPRTSFIRWFSSVLLIGTVVLLTLQLIAYSRDRANFPSGLVIAGVPVGGLSRQAAAERLLSVYGLPVELEYGDALIHMSPSQVEFALNLEAMIAAADLERTSSSFWGGFWDYLWGNLSNPAEVPLDARYSEERLQNYLVQEIGARYDRPPAPAQAVPGTTQFDLGQPGTVLNVEQAMRSIETALFSPSQRTVRLGLQESSPARPNLQNLQVQLQQIMDVAGYDGLADIYFQDLASGQEMHFIYQQGRNLNTDPDITFSAMSLIKIPLLVSVYAHLDGEPSEAMLRYMNDMVVLSDNDASDRLMEAVIDPLVAPLRITDDMQTLGLENTFMAGQFRIGAPLLHRYTTPAMDRTDVFTDPDPYTQTTPSDMGMLLADMYQCAQNGGGALSAVFQGRITQAECQDMLNLLSLNRIALLLEAGAPEGTRIAHKHGWVTNPNTGVINTMADGGIVFSPTGDYVIVIFLYHPVQLIYDPASRMFADLAQAVYNYYTLPDREFPQ
ncbi:MAG: serine hydrolase [Anaerolineales bacterium]|nr:serine hydrolase [Anaerolineales bacterium]